MRPSLGRPTVERQVVWYCGTCRLPLKVEPKWAQPTTCRCEVPQIGHPTIVWHAR